MGFAEASPRLTKETYVGKQTSLGDLVTFVKGFLDLLRTQVKAEGLERRYW